MRPHFDEPQLTYQPIVLHALGLSHAVPVDDDGELLIMAILLNLLETNVDGWIEEAVMSIPEMERRTGIRAARIKTALDTLIAAGVLTRRRSEGYDSPYAYTLHMDSIYSPRTTQS